MTVHVHMRGGVNVTERLPIPTWRAVRLARRVPDDRGILPSRKDEPVDVVPGVV
jgi:hypothetical protein